MKTDDRSTLALSGSSIDHLFSPLAGARGIILAASGGPDSTALLLTAADWAQRAQRPRIEVGTVDHRMRAGARAEAEAVAALCRRLGFAHHLLEWRGETPRSRIQERAREIRYGLLLECARAIGADTVVTAHHADDQAETVLFRLLRGSGIAGLAGMAALSMRDGVTLARPLLALPKADLIAYCVDRGEPFATDPSNEDPRFARTRLRKLTALLAAEGLGAAELGRLARRAARMEQAVARQTEAARARLAWSPAGTCAAAALFAEPLEVAQRLLAARMAEIAGPHGHPPDLEQLERLASALAAAAKQNAPLRANVGGVRVELDARGAILVAPERPRGRTTAADPDQGP